MNLKRTYATTLTDHELLVLDPLFEHRSMLRNLFQDGFEGNWNLERHCLKDQEVRTLVGDLVNRGWLTTTNIKSSSGRHDDPDDAIIALTSLGGSQWELERRPDWNRFIAWGGFIDAAGNTFQGIWGTSWKIIDDYFTVDQEIGFLERADVRWTKAAVRRSQKFSPIYWKRFPQVYMVTFGLQNQRKEELDFDGIDDRRTWWFCLNDSQSSWPL